MAIVMVRPKAAWARFGDSRSGGYEKVKKQLLPPLVVLGPRMRGLPEHEIDAINSARIAGKSDDQIRQLVRDLVVARRSAT